MAMLRDTIALVTGASRGVGKGVALGLAEAGATIYVTGRTIDEGHGVAGLPGTIHQTVAAVNQLGGHGIGIRCDHRDDEAVRALFDRITTDHGRLDILVNNVWGGYEYFWDGTEFWAEKGFWTMPLSRWEAMFQAGVRAHYVCSALAAPLMVQQRSGLIVNISFFAAQKADSGVIYGAAKAADDRMAACMAHDLREFNVAAVSLYPGLVRTESVLRAAEHFDLSNSESPRFIGRAVSALAADPEIMRRSGQVLVAAELAAEYGFVDVDGQRPTSLRGT